MADPGVRTDRPWTHPDRWGWVEHPSSPEDWTALVDEAVSIRLSNRAPKRTPYEEVRKPLERIFEIVAAAGCTSVLIENRYVDADYRSEYSRYWSRTFEGRPAFARRLHFFKARIDESDVHRLPSPPEAGYLGYTVLRPTPQGPVGRTMIAPPSELLDGRGCVLTTVEDEVHILGQTFTVAAAPFCQQDTQFLRCAHVAAWMCHFAAYRRGVVGRQLSAAFTDAAPLQLSFDRYAPAHGMNVFQLQATFAAFHLPAAVYDLKNLPDVASLSDTETHATEWVANGSAETGGQSQAPAKTLFDPNLVPIACMHLNSGVPILVATDSDHAFTLIGWYRDGDEVTFIVNDDTKGPYQTSTPSADASSNKEWMLLMVPLPSNIFLQAEEAENNALATLRQFADDGEDENAALVGGRVVRGELKLRTALREGSSYKRDIAARSLPEEVVRLVRHAHLPHYVWVTEAHDPGRCSDGHPCVVAEILHDATSENVEPRIDLLLLRGVALTFPPERDASSDSSKHVPESWVSGLPVCGTVPRA
jgi:hypothetical protein